ncbi:hypothetical protein ACDP63_09490 [Paracoccus sp. P2]|uniref:hypothetical protein n=1 Tax=Paracoccus sp. P2 TaxID=3248840 RepID=UPI00391F99C5
MTMLSISYHTRCRPVPQTVHVTIYEHRHGTNVRVFLDAAQAQAWRTRIAREWWHHEFDDDPPPEDEIGAEYFERMLERDEFFSTMICEIEGSRHESADPANSVPETEDGGTT